MKLRAAPVIDGVVLQRRRLRHGRRRRDGRRTRAAALARDVVVPAAPVVRAAVVAVRAVVSSQPHPPQRGFMNCELSMLSMHMNAGAPVVFVRGRMVARAVALDARPPLIDRHVLVVRVVVRAVAVHVEVVLPPVSVPVVTRGGGAWAKALSTSCGTRRVRARAAAAAPPHRSRRSSKSRLLSQECPCLPRSNRGCTNPCSTHPGCTRSGPNRRRCAVDLAHAGRLAKLVLLGSSRDTRPDDSSPRPPPSNFGRFQDT